VKTRVRVKRAALIKVVDGRLRKAENEYKRAVAAHPAKQAAWEAACIAKLEKSLTLAKAGKMPSDRYGNREVSFPSPPQKPSEARSTCNLRRMLTTLRMGSEETLLLSQEDADDYFGPCTL
jgi:hypothetical protein